MDDYLQADDSLIHRLSENGGTQPPFDWGESHHPAMTFDYRGHQVIIWRVDLSRRWFSPEKPGKSENVVWAPTVDGKEVAYRSKSSTRKRAVNLAKSAIDQMADNLVKPDDISHTESATQAWLTFGKLLTEARAKRQTEQTGPPDLT